MIFADSRYNRHEKRTKLPKWIQQFLRPSHLNATTESALDMVRSFLREMAQPVAPEQVRTILMDEASLVSRSAAAAAPHMPQPSLQPQPPQPPQLPRQPLKAPQLSQPPQPQPTTTEGGTAVTEASEMGSLLPDDAVDGDDDADGLLRPRSKASEERPPTAGSPLSGGSATKKPRFDYLE